MMKSKYLLGFCTLISTFWLLSCKDHNYEDQLEEDLKNAKLEKNAKHEKYSSDTITTDSVWDTHDIIPVPIELTLIYDENTYIYEPSDDEVIRQSLYEQMEKISGEYGIFRAKEYRTGMYLKDIAIKRSVNDSVWHYVGHAVYNNIGAIRDIKTVYFHKNKGRTCFSISSKPCQIKEDGSIIRYNYY